MAENRNTREKALLNQIHEMRRSLAARADEIKRLTAANAELERLTPEVARLNALNAALQAKTVEIDQAKATLQAQYEKVVQKQHELLTQRDGLLETQRLDAAKIADLKERLAVAETENQRMRGYIQRVQEDDVVREDLVETGHEHGERVLVPKRKHQSFEAPSPAKSMMDAYQNSAERQRPRPTGHWVRY